MSMDTRDAGKVRLGGCTPSLLNTHDTGKVRLGGCSPSFPQTKSLSRRNAMRMASALTAVGLAAACTTTTTNGVTSVTINVPTLLTYIAGAVSLVSAFLGFPGVGALIGAATVAAINGVAGQVNAAIPAVQNAAGSSATFTFNTTSAPAFIASLETDGAALLKDLTAAFTGAGATLPSAATQYYNGAVSVLNAISALLEVSVAAAPASRMSVHDALALVHINAS